jgi:hypothetical protein
MTTNTAGLFGRENGLGPSLDAANITPGKRASVLRAAEYVYAFAR